MIREFSKRGALLSPAVLLILFFTVCGYCQESKVVFECGDIGVEARRVLTRLKEKRTGVEQRQKELDKRENELKILQTEVDKKIERLRQLRKELKKILSEKNQVEKEKVKRLSKIYQEREPAAAAANLAAMDKDLAVSVLSMMREKYAGEILDGMKQETAVLYSTALGRLDE